ncbi:MAG: hypothetical protein BAJALOKI1v1_2140005 [Promethearchaeota archaeon]|nr:MAG: hypothetical protein BAJALOKI1v1_2140005 [Candidatus Lokiarchaeota archaeon]
MELERVIKVNKDALKFFQSYVSTMIDIGGGNLPKTISSKLGSKLAKIYKSKGISNIKEALKKSYEALKAKPVITDINENTFEVKINYSESFCPIGGKGSTSSHKSRVIQDSICIPFTQGFLTELQPDFSYEGKIEECIIESGGNTCRYKFTIKKR